MGLIPVAVDGGLFRMTNFGGLGLIVENKGESVRIRWEEDRDDEKNDNQSQKNERKDIQFNIHPCVLKIMKMKYGLSSGEYESKRGYSPDYKDGRKQEISI